MRHLIPIPSEFQALSLGGTNTRWLVFDAVPTSPGAWLAQAEMVVEHYLVLTAADCDLDVAVAEREFAAGTTPFEYARRAVAEYDLDEYVPIPSAESLVEALAECSAATQDG